MLYNSTEKRCLRNLAATQFPGCTDKYGTRGSLLHVILDNQQHPERIDLDICFDFSKVDLWVYGEAAEDDWYDEDTCYAGKTLYDLLNKMLDAQERLSEDTERQLEEQCSNLDSDNHVLDDILETFGFDPENLYAYRMVYGEPTVKGFALTHNAAERLSADIDNHIFGKLSFYATVPDTFHDDAGDFTVLVELLKKIGQQLLDQDHRSIHIAVPTVTGKDVLSACQAASGTSGKYQLSAKVSIDENVEDDLKELAGKDVFIGVEISNVSIATIPSFFKNNASADQFRIEGDWKCWMKGNDGTILHESKYPFAHDRIMKSLTNEKSRDNWFRLFDYLRFSNH